MRIFYFSIFLLISEFAFAQACPPENGATRIKLRCKVGERDTVNKPLWVVDGIVVTEEQVAAIDPNTIESVNILKNDTLIGCHQNGRSGIIVVTLKKIKNVLTIADEENGQGIPAASLQLISAKDSSRQAADERGQVIKKKLVNGNSYTVQVTAIGYLPVKLSLTDGYMPDSIKMQRKAVCEENVTVVATNRIRRVCYMVCGLTMITINEQKKEDRISANTQFLTYPNPLPRGQQQAIEWTAGKTSSYTLQVFDQGGKLLWNTDIKAKEGVNRYTWQPVQQWPAGTYILRLSSADGQYQASSKVVRL
ncbi:T9SS type A sorting domain-containing protein [Terrimonas ferruginea]|uniref:T9SS type A sorting domain-containing protein n=1 Tax=Terrimonas ferruginea TaxID=249 RepID=UPI0003F5B3CC|nr:T9SS type A sorting domain-containing protein [Terrimonas ferruginea]